MTYLDLMSTHTRRHVVIYAIFSVSLFLVASAILSKNSSRLLKLSSGASSTHGKELLLVQTVFRHGARTPLANIYFSQNKWEHCGKFEGVKLKLYDENGGKQPPPILDLDSPPLPGGCRQGELTQSGYSMAKDLGSWLRVRFTQELPFLSPDFKADEVSLRTTCIARTGATLQGVLTGMWPDAAKPRASAIFVNASQEYQEIEYGKHVTCPSLGPKMALLQAKVAARDAQDAKAQTLAAKVAARLHLTSASLSWVRLHDMLAAMVAEELPLPEGADMALVEEVSNQAILREGAVIAPIPEQNFLSLEECQEVIRLSIGSMLQRIVANMQQAGRQQQQQQQQQHQQQQQQRQQRSSSEGSSRGLMGGSSKGVSSFLGTAHAGEALGGGVRQQYRDDAMDGDGWLNVGLEGEADQQGASSRRVLEEASRSAAGVKMPKLYMFSGHDSTITPLMAALGAPLSTWPPFTSNVVFELWDSKKRSMEDGRPSEDELEVRLLYDRKPLVLKHLGGRKGGWISLKDLMEQLAPYTSTPQQHQAECAAV